MSNQQQSKELMFQLPDGFWKKIVYVVSIAGPAGILMSASMGPGTISSTLTAGATYGYDLLWFVVLSGIMGAVVCFAGGKVTAVTGKPVFEFMREQMGHWATVLLVLALSTWYLVIISEGKILYEVTSTIIPQLKGYAFLVVFVQCVIVAWVFTKGFKNVVMITGGMCIVMAAIFLLNLFVVKPSVASMAAGMLPTIPPGAGKMAISGILGGAAPGLLIIHYTFSIKDQGWDKPSAIPFMAWDQAIFYGFLFVIFSVGTYLSAAAVLHPAGIEVSSAINAAKSIEPIAGSSASTILLLGLWAAVFTTIGGMSSMGAYALSSIFNMKPSLEERHAKIIIGISCLLPVFGILIGSLPALPLIVWGMAMLTVTGPIFMGIILYYGNKKNIMGEHTFGWLHNIFLAIAFIANVYAAYIIVASWFGA